MEGLFFYLFYLLFFRFILCWLEQLVRNTNMVISNTRSASTRKGYERKIRQIISFYIENDKLAELNDDCSALNLPLNINSVKAFLAAYSPIPLHLLDAENNNDNDNAANNRGGNNRSNNNNDDDSDGDDDAADEYVISNNNNANNNTTAERSTKTSSTVCGFISALKYYYEVHNQLIAPELQVVFTRYSKGYRRLTAKMKQGGQMKRQEGKLPVSFDIYAFLAKKLAAMDCNTFAVPYLLLCWNLCNRSVSTAYITLDHMWWEGDCLVIAADTSKSHQDGSLIDKNVYANPRNPSICAILWLAVHIFTFARGPDKRLFEGEHQNMHFSKVLSRLLETLQDGQLLSDLEDIGTHSFRKGAATYLLNEVDGANPVQVYLRCEWSLGKVKDQYVFSTRGGDKLTGRAASGLPSNHVDFTLLPPHFSPAFAQTIPYDSIVANHSLYPARFRTVFPFLIASLAYHREFLNETLSQSHGLRHSRVWSKLEEYAAHVHVGHGENRVTGMRATGSSLSYNMLVMLKNVNDKCDRMDDKFDARFDELRSSLTTAVPDTIVERILERVSVNGAIPVTKEDFIAQMLVFKELIREEMQKAFDRSSQARPGAAPSAAAAAPAQAAPPANPNYQFYAWPNGSMQMVPLGWSLRSKRHNAKGMWDRWWRGDPDEKIQPFRYLQNVHFPGPTNEVERNHLAKVTKVMGEITAIAVEQGVDTNTLASMAIPAFDEIFMRVFTAFTLKYHVNKKRIYAKTCGTLRNYIKKQRPNPDGDGDDDDDDDSDSSSDDDDDDDDGGNDNNNNISDNRGNFNSNRNTNRNNNNNNNNNNINNSNTHRGRNRNRGGALHTNGINMPPNNNSNNIANNNVGTRRNATNPRRISRTNTRTNTPGITRRNTRSSSRGRGRGSNARDSN